MAHQYEIIGAETKFEFIGNILHMVYSWKKGIKKLLKGNICTIILQKITSY